MKIIKFIFKFYLVLFVIGIGMSIINGFGSSNEEVIYTPDHNAVNEDTAYTSDNNAVNEDAAYTSDDNAVNEYTDDYYVEETEAWSDTHTTAPVPDPAVCGEGYLGGFTTADGTAEIYFYEVDGQRYYYGTIYGVYCEGIAEVYESHGAIYCLDSSKDDGTIAVSFYMEYDESNEMSPYVLYEQAYGTGFYWHHH